MTNLEKLKEVFPHDWQNFYCTIRWMYEEYNPVKIKKTNLKVFEDVFGQTGDVEDVTPLDKRFWGETYKGENV